MTPEQIKQIAEEYLELIDFDNFYTPVEITRLEVKRFLKFLSERYCVVERSKVVDLYNKMEIDGCHVDTDNDWAIYEAMDKMEDIFGSETFNKKEDD